MEKYNLYEVESRAEELLSEQEGFSTEYVIRFDLCGPKGRLAQRFLDVYMGLIADDVENPNGFSCLSDLRRVAPDLWVENLRVERLTREVA